MNRTLPIVLLFVCGVLLGPCPAAGQARLSREENDRARLIGVLALSRLSVQFDEAPARAAFRSLSLALGVPIIGRYSDDRIGHGIDPRTPITLSAACVDGRAILEMVLEQCEIFEPCTWQLRKGCIEVGTKERLSSPAACESRMYPVSDLLIEPPYFSSGGGVGVESVHRFHELPYATAALSVPTDEGRKRPGELIEELVSGIVQTIEPGNWDWGQFEEESTEKEDDPPKKEIGERRGREAEPGRSDVDRHYRAKMKIARIRIWNDRIIIRAPDFIHRQVGGYPDVILPAPLSEEERAERSAAASSGRSNIVVLPGRKETEGGSQ